jgi:DNA polymerase-4
MTAPGPYMGRPHLGGKRPGPSALGPGAVAYGEHWERVILHLDMNAFFAAVEQQANPHLRGKPVLITGSRKWRSVVSTASYEARRYGISAGMPTGEAVRLCPSAVMVPADGHKYASALREFTATAEGFSPVVEVFSIDELFLDITGTFGRWGTPRALGRALKDAIKSELGLTCSVGIAPNKMLAKLASGMEKPDGLTVLRPSTVADTLEDLPVTELAGIGARMALHLRRLGAWTCGRLARVPRRRLRARFGIIGEVLSDMARGVDRRPVVPYERIEDARSVGHSTTLTHDIYDEDEIRRVFLMLCERVGRRMRKGSYSGRCVSAYCRYPDFFTVGRSHRLDRFVDEGMDIFEAGRHLLPGDMTRRGVRLLGVSVSMLIRHARPLGLFEQRRDRLTEAVDALNEKYGEAGLARASLLPGQVHPITTLPTIHPNPSPIRAVFGMDIG